ncbi:serum response factor-like isoform X1 [Vanacampus margaritifer]
MGSRSGSGPTPPPLPPPAHGAGTGAAGETDAGRFDDRRFEDSEDSDFDEDPVRASPGGGGGGGGGAPLAQQPAGTPGAKPGKKTRGRVKIKMAFIDNKLRRYTTFSKRKTGIMKKAYELSTLTGTQVLLLVASETGHVYTFATRKLQPMITSETGKALIQTCLNSPDSPPRSDPSCDQRMSATGFQETDLTYQVSEAPDGCPDKDLGQGLFNGPNMAAGRPSAQAQIGAANGTLLKTPAGVVLPAGFTLVSGASLPAAPHAQQSALLRLPAAAVSLSGGGVSQVASTNQSTSDIPSPASSAAAAAASSAGHVMYPGGHALMYAPAAPSLADAGLAVLNAASHELASVPQVFLASVPHVSAVQLHPMVLSQQNGGGGANLTELQLVGLDASHAKDD